ncbi:MAG: DUF362 domain-containing protein [Bryobacterales bacterium]|nr:DUF362 domain-containing protein [Bryobacterales bacterium]
MSRVSRRKFVLASSQAAAAAALFGAAQAKPRIGLVQSTHKRLAKPLSADHPLDYETVRDMVWKAIEYGRPRAGSLEAKIKPGSWVVIKPNIVYLKPQPGYRPGDITDLRVTRAVLEYVASKSRAGRITIAEGGSYRSLGDPLKDNVVTQGGERVDATNFDWGTEDFPGAGGTLDGMLQDFRKAHPGKKFDYVDLSYDVVRDAAGNPLRVAVPRLNGVGSFSNRQEYFITNTIRNCDFLLNVPVMKVHENCGTTACFKNYVGTAPRCVYGRPNIFWNAELHDQHSVDTRIDPFIADLAAYHPPDYNVVDGIRGLQSTEHNNRQPDQMVRSNLIVAGEDTVAADAVVAKLLGFQPADIDFLHMGAARGLGTMELSGIEIAGDELDRLSRQWAKPRSWYARANRDWLVSRDPDSNPSGWKRHTSFGDTLYFAKALDGTGPVYAAAAKVRASGNLKGYLWLGLTGKVAVTLNGQQIMTEENVTRYRVGQFQKAVELRPGENQLLFRVEAVGDRPAQMAAVLIGPANNGDSLEGARWTV